LDLPENVFAGGYNGIPEDILSFFVRLLSRQVDLFILFFSYFQLWLYGVRNLIFRSLLNICFSKADEHLRFLITDSFDLAGWNQDFLT